MKKIYIAGPDVFLKNSISVGEKLLILCKEYGYKGLYPLDNIVDFTQDKHKIAKDIYEANIAMIHKADIIIANLNMFRGKEADSGTVWECGYAHALGKRVYAYMDSTREYIDNFDDKVKEDEFYLDKDETIIEDFSHPINLMIACSCDAIIEGTFVDVLKSLKT